MRTFKYLLVIVLLMGIFAALSYLWLAAPVITGYGAKNLCSCVFISGRNAEEVKNAELSYSFIKYGDYEVNYKDSSVTGTLLSLAPRKALYRQGLGCTLIVGAQEEELKAQAVSLPEVSISDSLDWPYGSMLNDSVPSGTNVEQVLGVVNKAMENIYGPGTRGVVVVYKDHLIAEQYKAPFTAATPQLGWSMAKSATNALMGIMVKKGKFNVNDPAPIGFWQNDSRKDITINNLMRMNSGLEWEEDYGGLSTANQMLFKSSNAGLFAAQQPLDEKPGSRWSYSSGTTNIISYLIKQELPEGEYLTFPHKELFNKLGMSSAVLEPDASGTFVGSSFMFATPRDWTKLGLLYLHDGVWNGERILPKGWVEYTSTPTDGSMGEYGAHFWLNIHHVRLKDVPEDAIIMAGFQGQRVIIIPSRNLVITRLGYNPEENFNFNAFVRDILKSL